MYFLFFTFTCCFSPWNYRIPMSWTGFLFNCYYRRGSSCLIIYDVTKIVFSLYIYIFWPKCGRGLVRGLDIVAWLVERLDLDILIKTSMIVVGLIMYCLEGQAWYLGNFSECGIRLMAPFWSRLGTCN